MPARITVKAELASLLAKSQETTDANRRAQLKKEADARADRQRLQAKKANEDAARKKPLEDPVGRNIFTAAMGSPPLQLGQFWWERPGAGGTATTLRVWSGDGTAVIETSIDSRDYPENFGWVGADDEMTKVRSGFPDNYGNPELFTATFGVPTKPSYINAIRERELGLGGFTYPINGTTSILVVTWDIYLGWRAAAADTTIEPPVLEVDNPNPPPGSVYTSLGTFPVGYLVGFGDYIYRKGTKAFLVSQSAVRELALPSAWASRPDAIIPGTRPLQAQVPLNVSGIFPLPGTFDCPGGVSNPAADNWLSNFFFTLGASVAARFSSNIGPVPFSTLANFSTVWTPEATRSFNRRTGSVPLTYSQRRADVPWGSTRETAFYRGPVDPDLWDSPHITKAALQMSNADYDSLPGGPPFLTASDPRLRPAKVLPGTPSPRREAPNSSIVAEERLFWDWGKPGYCRAQLLEMGFTEADLTP
jgi:hypothetical protein